MPYKIVKSEKENKYCVFKIDEEKQPIGKTLGCHESEEDAKKQLAALYASEDEDQDEKSVDMNLEIGLENGGVDLSGTLDTYNLTGMENSADKANLEQIIEEDDRRVPDKSASPMDFLDRQFDGLKQEGVVYVKSRFDANENSDNVDRVYKEFHQLINMSIDELEEWKKTKHSNKASLGRASINRVLSLLRKDKTDWSQEDIKNAKCAISFIARIKSEMDQEDRIGEFTRKDVVLRNWGHKIMKGAGYSIKALYEGEDGIRIGAYGMLWGDETNKDLHGEFFTPDTEDTMSVFKAMGAIPFIFHHGKLDKIKSFVAGRVVHMESDNVGLYYEAIIKEQELYMEYIRPLIQKQRLFSSSGTLPAAKKVLKSGNITRWPIAEMTGTHVPAEWRMVDHPIARKHYEELGLDIDEVSDLLNKNSAGFEKERELELNNQLLSLKLKLQNLTGD